MGKNIVNALAPGTMLRGGACTYRIERALGQGSFGITYLATTKGKVTGPLGEIETTTHVAVKEFFMKGVNGREGSTVTSGSRGGEYGKYREKFVREAKHLSNLHHGRIVRVLESFEANNTAYYSMEYIDGGSLKELIESRHGLSADECLRYVRQIGDALAYMHSHNMLHLDLKPGNVMLRGNGDAVLIDFGLSKQYDADGRPETSTTVGAGTPGYAPIEQANYHGGGKGPLPFTMDVYALGATAYKMLTGCEEMPDASKVLNDPSLIPSGLSARHVPKPLSDVVLKAMSPMRKDRYQSVEELLAACNGNPIPHKEEPIEVTVVEKEESAEQMLARANKLFNEEKYSEAVLLYRKLAERGISSAQDMLGYFYHCGHGIGKDYSEAVKWFRKAAMQGNRIAQYNLGACYENGQGVGKDLSEAKAWFGKAAAQGDSDANKALERLSSTESKSTNQKKDDKSNGDWVSGLGTALELYNRGDYGQALFGFSMAARKGNAFAQYMLGECFSTGRGTKQDYAAAVNWYSQAAAQDYLQAQLKLAAHYEEAKDYPEAVKWYRMAAKQGDAGAQNNLALCYEKGCGVTVNAGEAAYWYNKAAVQGYKEAQANLGRCYRDGLGVAKDQAKAREWFRKAANQGFEPAKKMLDGLPKENLIKKKESKKPNPNEKEENTFLRFCWRWFVFHLFITIGPFLLVAILFVDDLDINGNDEFLHFLMSVFSVVLCDFLIWRFRKTKFIEDKGAFIVPIGILAYIVLLILLPFLDREIVVPYAVLCLGASSMAALRFSFQYK